MAYASGISATRRTDFNDMIHLQTVTVDHKSSVSPLRILAYVIRTTRPDGAQEERSLRRPMNFSKQEDQIPVRRIFRIS